jgi:hypothetical protein
MKLSRRWLAVALAIALLAPMPAKADTPNVVCVLAASLGLTICGPQAPLPGAPVAPSSTPTASPVATPSPTPSAIPVVSVYQSAILADKPFSFYDLSSNTAADLSGNNRSITYVGIPTFGGSGAYFSNGYGTAPLPLVNNAISVEVTIVPTQADINGSPRILSNAWADNAGKGFMVWIDSQQIKFSVGWANLVAPMPLVAGQKYTITGTWDARVYPGMANIYINGKPMVTPVQVNQGGYNANPSTSDYSPDTLYLGVLNAINGGGPGIVGHFQGQVSNAVIYDYPLTGQQVINHYNAEMGTNDALPTPVPPTPAPTAPPTPMPLGAPIVYNSKNACIANKLYINDVLDGNANGTGAGEFGLSFNKAWWERTRTDGTGGNTHSGMTISWGRNQYDTYLADSETDGLTKPADDPFSWGPDTGAPGSPNAVGISAKPLPAYMVGDARTGGAHYISGILDTPIHQTYGFFVARVRLPKPSGGLSPAFWMLNNGTTRPVGAKGTLAGEWDIQEMFGPDYGNTQMNQGNILWNSGASTAQNWGGMMTLPNGATMDADYHDYGVLLMPGGSMVIDPNVYGPGGPGYTYGPVYGGMTNFIDGQPTYAHTGAADITANVDPKEFMAIFQVGADGGWLGTYDKTQPTPVYHIQWMRAYRPTTTSC